MKRGNIKKKIVPVVVAIVVAAVLLPVLLGALGAIGALRELGWEMPLFLVVYVLAVAAVIIGVVAAMCQRLKEIDGGEEDEAKKY